MTDQKQVAVDDTRQWHTRFRPTSLDTYIAPDRVKKLVREIISGKSNIGSVLVTGPTGTGKTTVARIIAYAVNGLPYGTASMDIHEHDAGDMRGIDDARSLVQRTKFLPMGKKRVMIVDEIHAFTGQAASALLKSLEEPSPHVLWILCTNEPEKLLPTIVNRCLPLSLDLPDPKDLRNHLMAVLKKTRSLRTDGIKERSKLCRAVIEAAGGIPRTSLQLLQTAVIARGEYDSVADLIKGPLLKTPTLELDKAAVKLLLCLAKIMKGGKPEVLAKTMKAAVATLNDVDNVVLLNRLLNLCAATVRELYSGLYVPQAYPLMTAAGHLDITLSPGAMARILNMLVSTKQNVGDFSVGPDVLLLNGITRLYETVLEEQDA